MEGRLLDIAALSGLETLRGSLTVKLSKEKRGPNDCIILNGKEVFREF